MTKLFQIVTTAAAVVLSTLLPAGAQDYPNQPVKLVVPFPAGGGTDALARWFAKGLEAKFGQPFVVENRAGSGTTLGAGYRRARGGGRLHHHAGQQARPTRSRPTSTRRCRSIPRRILRRSHWWPKCRSCWS